MPARAPVSGAIRVTLHFQLNAAEIVTTSQYYQYTGGPATATDLNSVASSIASAYASHGITFHRADVVLVSVTVQDLSSTTGALGIWTGSTAGTLAASTALPAGTAVVALYKTARHYRGGHARGYWPAFGQAQLAGGWNQWSSGVVGTFGTALTALQTAINAITVGTCNIQNQAAISWYSGFTNQSYGSPVKYRRVATPRGTPLVDRVTSIVISPIPGSQRRRYGR